MQKTKGWYLGQLPLTTFAYGLKTDSASFKEMIGAQIGEVREWIIAKELKGLANKISFFDRLLVYLGFKSIPLVDMVYREDINPNLLVQVYGTSEEVWGRYVCKRCKQVPVYIGHTCGVTHGFSDGFFCLLHGCLDHGQ